MSLSFLDLLSIALGGVTLMVVMFTLSLKRGLATEERAFLALSIRLRLTSTVGPERLRADLERDPPRVQLRAKFGAASPDAWCEADPGEPGLRAEAFGEVRWVFQFNEAKAVAGGADAEVEVHCVCTGLRRGFTPSLYVTPRPTAKLAAASVAYRTRDQIADFEFDALTCDKLPPVVIPDETAPAAEVPK